MTGLVKNVLKKVIGCGLLSCQELEEVLLALVTLNDRPVSYVEDDVVLPIFTPNSIVFPTTNNLTCNSRSAAQSQTPLPVQGCNVEKMVKRVPLEALEKCTILSILKSPALWLLEMQ